MTDIRQGPDYDQQDMTHSVPTPAYALNEAAQDPDAVQRKVDSQNCTTNVPGGNLPNAAIYGDKGPPIS